MVTVVNPLKEDGRQILCVLAIHSVYIVYTNTGETCHDSFHLAQLKDSLSLCAQRYTHTGV